MQWGKPSVASETRERKQCKSWTKAKTASELSLGWPSAAAGSLFRFSASPLKLGNSQAFLVSPPVPCADSRSAARLPADLQALTSPSHPWATLSSGCFPLLGCSMSGCKLISHCPALSLGSGDVFAMWKQLEHSEFPLAASLTPPWHRVVTQWCPVCIPACSGMHRWG